MQISIFGSLLSHSALDNQFKIFPQAMYKNAFAELKGLRCGPCECIHFFLPEMGVVMAKFLSAKLDQILGLVGLGVIPSLIIIYL